MPLLRLRLAYPDLLVDVGALAELRGVTDAGGRTAHRCADHALPAGRTTRWWPSTAGCWRRRPPPWPTPPCATAALWAARSRTPTRPVTCPPSALALDATLLARGPGGEREIAAADFFVDYLTSALEPGEILTAVRIPKLGPDWGYQYEKFHRTAQAWATVGVAALARRSNGTVAEARIGLASMGPVPVRATATEAAAAGAAASRDALQAAAASAADGTEPPADLHGAADYRRHLARILTGRALAAAAGL